MNLYDLAYAGGLAISAPLWLARGAARRKVLGALRQRMGQVPARTDAAPAILIHAVSLGEMNATRSLVAELETQRPDLRFILTATTETGLARGLQLYGQHPRATVVRYPLDFTQAVSRVLDRLRPDVAALMELEVWPNFLRQCGRRGIPVAVLNGRLTDKSFGNYRMARPLVRGMFRRLSHICAQEETYARRFIELGAAAENVEVAGTMKFDTAPAGERVEGDEQLAAAVGLRPGVAPIWVCGSTGPGEEQIVLDAYAKLLPQFPALRLVISPRKPERFDETANLIASRGYKVLRKSQAPQPDASDTDAQAVVLGDTMGELRKFYSLADVVFVGRTLVDLGPRQHGSDMIEPAALGKPVVVGPFTGNFAEPMRCFRAAGAMVEIQHPAQLAQAIGNFLAHPDHARKMGQTARQVVQSQRGATQRHVKVLLSLLERSRRGTPAPATP